MTGTTSAAWPFELVNIGTAPLQISSIALSGSNASSFAVTTGANACASTLAAGLACSIYVTFNPSTVANCSATLTVTDNSATPTQTIALTGPATPGLGAGQTPDTRAAAMLTLMTQAEKLQLVQGGVTTNLTYGYTVPLGAAGYVPGIPRLGIPELYLADGSVGVGNGVGPATALPSSIANAASFVLHMVMACVLMLVSVGVKHGIAAEPNTLAHHREGSDRAVLSHTALGATYASGWTPGAGCGG